MLTVLGRHLGFECQRKSRLGVVTQSLWGVYVVATDGYRIRNEWIRREEVKVDLPEGIERCVPRMFGHGGIEWWKGRKNMYDSEVNGRLTSLDGWSVKALNNRGWTLEQERMTTCHSWVESDVE